MIDMLVAMEAFKWCIAMGGLTWRVAIQAEDGEAKPWWIAMESLAIVNCHAWLNLMNSHGSLRIMNCNGGLKVMHSHGSFKMMNGHWRLKTIHCHGRLKIVNGHGRLKMMNCHGRLPIMNGHGRLKMMNGHGRLNHCDEWLLCTWMANHVYSSVAFYVYGHEWLWLHCYVWACVYHVN